MNNIKLEYLKGSREKNEWMRQYGQADGRMWNMLVPINHPLYAFNQSTRTIDGLRELGVIKWF